MEKVKISKLQADALNGFITLDREDIVRKHSQDTTESLWTGVHEALNDLSLNTLVKALYIGYEVEETPEVKVRELYNYFGQAVPYSGIDVQNKIGIILSTLNIKIEGIN